MKIDIIINVSMAVSSPVSEIDVMSDMAAEYGLSCVSTDHWENGR